MEARVAALALCALSACASSPEVAVSHEPSHKHMGGAHRFDDAAKWSRIFDAAERDEWQKPDVVLAALALEPADVVADIGAGTGYFAVRLARAVPAGRVYGVDIEDAMVAFLSERAAKEGLANLIAVKGEAGDPRLPEKVTAALVVDTAHHIEDLPAYFTAVRAQMQPGGRLVFVEFHADRELPVGPPRAMRIGHEKLTSAMQAAGFERTAVDVDALPNQYIASYRAQ